MIGLDGWRSAAAGAVALGIVALGSPASAVDIKMWTLVTEGYPEFVAYAAEEYKKAHPDVNIIYENFPNEAYKTQIQVALTGSEPPDVFFNWAGEDAARLVREGLALDITDLGNAEGGFRHSLSDSWQSHFMYQGRNYGVPTDAVSKFFYYDKSVLRRARPHAAHDLRRPLAALPRHPRHRSGARAVAARQLRALEA